MIQIVKVKDLDKNMTEVIGDSYFVVCESMTIREHIRHTENVFGLDKSNLDMIDDKQLTEYMYGIEVLYSL